jgi:hypothetical protein
MFKHFIKLLLKFEFNNSSKKSRVISGKQSDTEKPEYRFAISVARKLQFCKLRVRIVLMFVIVDLEEVFK